MILESEMNKSDVIDVLAKKHNLSNDQAMQIIDLVFDGYTKTLKNNGRIEIRGFGSFAIKEYGAYEGRNPKTGNIVEVKPKRLPVFKVGKELKEMVDGK
jgi:integration host factor subunit beta